MTAPLSLKARMTYTAHLFKAVTRQHHIPLRPLFAEYLPRDGIVIDVGAHAGQFTKLFSALVPDGHVYAFEPGGYALSILKKVHLLRRLKNVTIVASALGDSDGEAVLKVPVKESGSIAFGLSSVGKMQDNSRAIRTETIPVTTLDGFAEQNGLTRLDVIKADIEGWELRMLEGARQVLQKFRPCLAIEAADHMLQRAGDTREKLATFLREMNYTAFIYDQDGTLTPDDGRDADLFCIPVEKQLSS